MGEPDLNSESLSQVRFPNRHGTGIRLTSFRLSPIHANSGPVALLPIDKDDL